MTTSNHNHRILAFAAAVLSVFLCSCEYEFDLADVSSEPDRLNIICTMDELSYPTLSAKVAVPINKYDDVQSINKEIEYCDLYINGNKTTLEQYVTDGMGTNWRSSQKANPGDELSIKAKGRTTVLAEASVRVPDVLSISKIDTTSIYIDSHFEYRSEMRFSILFDHISKGDCIELRISMRRLSDIESGIPMESPLRITRTDGTSFIYSMDRNSDAIVIESSELKTATDSILSPITLNRCREMNLTVISSRHQRSAQVTTDTPSHYICRTTTFWPTWDSQLQITVIPISREVSEYLPQVHLSSFPRSVSDDLIWSIIS